jgi:hypothetical protein
MNVVVVAAHGLNAHWLGPYGNEWVTTPALDALAAESIVFDRHFAGTPSAAGFATDTAPIVNQPGRFKILVDDRRNPIPTPHDWDVVIRPPAGSSEPPGELLRTAVRDALKQLKDRAGRLLWIDTDRLLPPWDLEYETYQHYAETTGGFTDDSPDAEDLPEPTDTPPTGWIDVEDRRLWHQIRNSFAAAVSSFDAELGQLFEDFRRAGLDQSAPWVVTSGFGHPLGEHGVVGTAGSRMHVELTHLPLIVRIPGVRSRRAAAFTQPSDLAALIENNPPKGRDFVVSRIGAEVAIRTADWTFLPATDRPARLYVRPDDIWEVNDVAARHPDECDRLAAVIPQEPIP